MSIDKYIQRSVPTYDDFKKSRVKYDGTTKCFVFDCNKPGLYEGGDARFYCGMCEEHSGLRSSYRMYLRGLISNANALLSAEELYDVAQNSVNKLTEKLNIALEQEYGPEFSKT